MERSRLARRDDERTEARQRTSRSLPITRTLEHLNVQQEFSHCFLALGQDGLTVHTSVSVDKFARVGTNFLDRDDVVLDEPVGDCEERRGVSRGGF